MEMMIIIGGTLRALPFDDFKDSLSGKEVQSDVSEAAGLMSMIRSMGGAK